MSEKAVVAAVQGNIPQDEKWTPESKFSTLAVYSRLTVEGTLERKLDLVVWPETALPFYPQNDPLYFKVTGLAEELKIYLLTGAPYFTLAVGSTREKPAVSYYNSALLIKPDGGMVERYDKQHLVPYGEYVPLRRFLPFLEPLVVNAGNMVPGSSNVQLNAGKIRAGMLICYESIFPELARQQARDGANLLVNITNDAWYGRSSAPYQSFAMSVLRSVENRMSLVRAANTGISGFVDPLGRVLSQSPLFETLILSAEVPLLREKTIYLRYGFLFGPACLVIMTVLLLYRWKRGEGSV